MDERQRILFVSNNFPNPAEPARGVFNLQLVKELQLQADVAVVSPLPWFPKWLDFERLRKWRHFARIPRVYEVEGITVHSPKYLYFPKVAEPLHAITMFVWTLVSLLKLRRKMASDVLVVHWLYPDGVAASWFARILGMPIVLCAEGCDVNEFLADRAKRLQIIPSLMSASHIITVSRDLTAKLVDRNVPASKISTIGNGVNKDIFSQNKLLSHDRIDDETQVIVFVGRLSEEKDVGILLEAISLLQRTRQDFRVCIVGDGPERESLEEYSSAQCLDGSVSFVGQVPHQQVSDYLGQSDVFCLPSKREGCPNAILEALASGTPVVAFKVGGIPDMVTSNTGILVDDRTPECLMVALSDALDKSWNKSAIADSVKDQTWERVATRYVDIIGQVLSEEDD